MDKEQLKTIIRTHFPEVLLTENKQFTEVKIPLQKIHELCHFLKNDQETLFDYLFCLTAVDWNTNITVVYHLTSTFLRHSIMLKTEISDRKNPVVDSVSDIWHAANPFEREVFDLFGVKFNNHPDLRRLFMDDDYGYPLRKDFIDEINLIER